MVIFMGAKLMSITPLTVVSRVYIELLNGGYKPTYDWEGHKLVCTYRTTQFPKESPHVSTLYH